MFWDSNLGHLKENVHFMHDLPKLETADTDRLGWIIAETVDGLTLIVDGIPLHDPDGAISEAERLIAEKLHPGDYNMHILFGLGLGYMLAEAVKRTNGLIIVYEPHLPLLKFLLTEVDYGELLAHPNVTICTTTQQLAFVLQHYIQVHGNLDGVLDGIVNLGYASYFSTPAIKDVATVVEKVLGQQHNYFRMGLSMNPTWQETSVANIVHLPNVEPFANIARAFPDKPIIILSAGPSLEHYMHDLLHWRHHMVTVAVAAALKPLMEAGIVPDFVAVLDYAGAEYQFKNLDTSQTRLLLSPFANAIAWTCPARSHHLVNFYNYHNLAEWFDEGTGIKNTAIGSGGTVSLMSTSMASEMGGNPIILLGQDLAFRGTQQYAGNVHVKITDGFYESSESHVSGGIRLKVVEIEGQKGETLLTSPDYLQFKDQFVELGRTLKHIRPGIKLYNASIGGAHIPEFELKPLAEIAEQEGWSSLPPVDKTVRSGTALDNAGFIPLLETLQQQIESSLQLGQFLLSELGRWKKTVRNRGATAERSIQLDVMQGNFVEALGASWLIYGYLGNEIWTWQKLFNRDALSVERVEQEIDCVRRMLELLEHDLLVTVNKTLATVKETNQVINH